MLRILQKIVFICLTLLTGALMMPSGAHAAEVPLPNPKSAAAGTAVTFSSLVLSDAAGTAVTPSALALTDADGTVHRFYTTDDSVTVRKIGGLSYDPKKNLLTMDRYSGPENTLQVISMGHDFRIRLKGTNELSGISIGAILDEDKGFGQGGSVTFEGSGTLTLNRDRTRDYGLSIPIPDKENHITIRRTAKVISYGSEEGAAFYIRSTQAAGSKVLITGSDSTSLPERSTSVLPKYSGCFIQSSSYFDRDKKGTIYKKNGQNYLFLKRDGNSREYTKYFLFQGKNKKYYALSADRFYSKIPSSYKRQSKTVSVSIVYYRACEKALHDEKDAFLYYRLQYSDGDADIQRLKKATSLPALGGAGIYQIQKIYADRLPSGYRTKTQKIYTFRTTNFS